MTLPELASEVDRAKKVKSSLEAAKAKDAKAFTEKQQSDLNSVTLYLVDAEEVLAQKEAEAIAAAKAAETEATAEKYVPAKGTEKLVHVQLAKGRRFNPNTGKEETKPYVQTFTFGEWQLFEKNYKRLGFTVLSVLHDPYNVVKLS